MRKILVADDSVTTRAILRSCVEHWGYEPVVAEDGLRAWEILSGPDSPCIAVLDWVMPFLSGPEICRRVRDAKADSYVYLILLTGKETRADRVEGLRAGADDCLAKPFDQQELEARLSTGVRILEFIKRRVDSLSLQVPSESH